MSSASGTGSPTRRTTAPTSCSTCSSRSSKRVGRRHRRQPAPHRCRLVRRSPARASLEHVPATSSSARLTAPTSRRGASCMVELDDEDFDGERTRSPTTTSRPNAASGDAEPCPGARSRSRRQEHLHEGPRRARGSPLRDEEPRGRARVGYELHPPSRSRRRVVRRHRPPEPRTRRPARDHHDLACPRGITSRRRRGPQADRRQAGGFDVDDVVWDRGYSQLRPETTSHPLNRSGIQPRPSAEGHAARGEAVLKTR